jgi:hypothetical protein
VAVLQFLRESRRSDRAVAFADQIFRRRKAAVGLEVVVDELAESAEIAAYAVELRVVHAGDDAAEAGIDGVDEHEIGRVDERVLVVHQLVWRRRLEAFRRHLHTLRGERPHVQPDGGGARTAVIEERDGTAPRLLAVFRVGDEEHPRRYLAVVEPNRQCAGRRRVFDLAAVQPDGVRGLRDLFFLFSGRLDARRRVATGRCGRCGLRRRSAAALRIGGRYRQRQQQQQTNRMFCHQATNSPTHQLIRQLTNSPISSSYSSSGAPPALTTSSCFTRSTLNFCALAMILSRASSKSNDVALENLV